eukprot:GEMP01018029.1.p1 GENE.GEMP01018029.1~~GEMP01018029.1.p1  ORF type:complete len:598 (+),score=100.56 GEMP01018029.1:118-1911(+)
MFYFIVSIFLTSVQGDPSEGASVHTFDHRISIVPHRTDTFQNDFECGSEQCDTMAEVSHSATHLREFVIDINRDIVVPSTGRALTCIHSVKFHFSSFNIPVGSVVRVADTNNVFYTDLRGNERDKVFRSELESNSTFTTMRLHGDVVKITLFPPDGRDMETTWGAQFSEQNNELVAAHSVVIDRVIVEECLTHAIIADRMKRRRLQRSSYKPDRCEKLTFKNIACARTDGNERFYAWHRKVAYLFIEKTFPADIQRTRPDKKPGLSTEGCTGWRVGKQPLLMTNYHCYAHANGPVQNSVEVAFFWQNEECSTHDDDKDYVQQAVHKVRLEKKLVEEGGSGGKDFALARIRADDFEGLNEMTGYFALNLNEPKVGTRVVILMHPASLPKKYSVGTIKGMSKKGIWTYDVDELAGSSGSPIVDAETGDILVLHTTLDGSSCLRSGAIPKSWWPLVKQYFGGKAPDGLTIVGDDHFAGAVDLLLAAGITAGVLSVVGMVLLQVCQRIMRRTAPNEPPVVRANIGPRVTPSVGNKTSNAQFVRPRAAVSPEAENRRDAARYGSSSSRNPKKTTSRHTRSKATGDSPRRKRKKRKKEAPAVE